MSTDETIREKIARFLEEAESPVSVRDIILSLGIEPSREKEIYEHLSHIAKTIRRRSSGRKVLYMVPPRCSSCGYVFTKLEKPHKPSRCPRCKSYRIEPPLFYISVE